ncbi:IS66 family insertion sequence element accessory protein TnpA [Desulfogranum marinum]|uniref:IS66 family insertion sequence element accessory protein TnpA n=1 Tax=Desulfogranum marinum TaxID=453220 RepID=UPI00374D60FF
MPPIQRRHTMLPETRENQTESKADFWRRHIENCNSSSLTQAQYCRQHSLAWVHPTFMECVNRALLRVI